MTTITYTFGPTARGFSARGAEIAATPFAPPPPDPKREAEQQALARAEAAYWQNIKKPVYVMVDGPQEGPRLPHYVTPDRLRRDGYSEDMIAILHPLSTPIAYHNAAARNAESREGFYAEGRNPNKEHINPYHSERRIVLGDANPDGGGVLGRAHYQGKAHPEEERKIYTYLYSPTEMKEKIETDYTRQGSAFNIAASMQQHLALPHRYDHISDATLQPGIYKAELSFTIGGAQQAIIDKNYVHYSRERRPDLRF